MAICRHASPRESGMPLPKYLVTSGSPMMAAYSSMSRCTNARSTRRSVVSVGIAVMRLLFRVRDTRMVSAVRLSARQQLPLSEPYHDIDPRERTYSRPSRRRADGSVIHRRRPRFLWSPARTFDALLHRDVGALQLLRDAGVFDSVHGARARLRRQARRIRIWHVHR